MLTYNKQVGIHKPNYWINLPIFTDEVVEFAIIHGQGSLSKVHVEYNESYTFIYFKNGDRIDIKNL